MDCKGEHWKASCTGGRCTLKCPSNSKTCNLICTVGPCKAVRPPSTPVTTVPPTNPQSTTPRNPSNPVQTCVRPQGASCRLTCPRRPNYSSCVQNCNKGNGSFFLKQFFASSQFLLSDFSGKRWKLYFKILVTCFSVPYTKQKGNKSPSCFYGLRTPWPC